MKTSLARPASLLALSLVLLSGCADMLDEPGNLPPPVDLGSSSGGTPLNGIPTRAQLAGSWRLMRANGSDVSGHQKITLSFFTDLSYIVGGEANDPGNYPRDSVLGHAQRTLVAYRRACHASEHTRTERKRLR